jgi:hypothetical protein
MLSIKGSNMGVYCLDDGKGLSISDYCTGESWVLDEKSLVYGEVDNEGGHKAKLSSMEAVKADIIGSDKLCLSYRAGSSKITMIYTVYSEYIEITLPVDTSGEIGIVSLPGSFLPSGDSKHLFPIMQGMLWDGRGEAFEQRIRESGHIGFSMAMFGVMGTKGSLLCIAETADDCLWHIGKDDSGRKWAANLQVDSLGTMRYDRCVRLYTTKSSITAIAKTYRKRIIEKGRFRSWEEKIMERPALKKLFGTIMCFIGYCQDELDYVEECEKLKAYGFDKALLYSVRFNTYSKKFSMGGFPPIHINKEDIQRMKDIGYDVAPWTWINEGIDDGSDEMRNRYRRNRKGELAATWQIDDNKWYSVCSTFMEEYQKNAIAGEFSDMTWDHFDVITCATSNECHALNHKSHMGRPLSKTEDREWLRKLLVAGQAKSRPVSSEGFNDAYSMEYDMGSVKAWAQYGPWEFWPIPLTMLVYHDSIMHTWWEPHNYNSRFFGGDFKKYQYGGGKTRLMATMDALYGCPPDVFPFGAMYGWTGKGSETFLYKFRFEDQDTQFALQLALPVARLHEKIGMLEMTDFEILSEDGYLQRTTFADGTQVYANFGVSRSKYMEGVGALQPESWVTVKG